MSTIRDEEEYIRWKYISAIGYINSAAAYVPMVMNTKQDYSPESSSPSD